MQISDARGTAALESPFTGCSSGRHSPRRPKKNPLRVCGGSRVSPRSSVRRRFLGFNDPLNYGVKDLDEAALHQFHYHRLRAQNVDNMSTRCSCF